MCEIKRIRFYGIERSQASIRDIADITDGIERLKLLKPRKFSWVDDPELGLRDGETLSGSRNLQGQSPYLINAGINLKTEKSNINSNMLINI